MLKHISSFIKNRRGAAIIEFAVTLPVVILIGFGTADFGRLFLETSVLANASSAGAIYAYRSTKEAANLSGAEAAVLSNVNGLKAVSADVTKLCDCPASPGAWVSCSSNCSGYGLPRIYIRSKAVKDFQTLGTYPGIPQQVDVGISSWLRVQ